MADVPEPGGCQSCPNPFPDYYTEARHLVSRMDELRKLADRLKAGHDLDAYCGVLAFRMHGLGGRDPKDAHRLLRKPLAALAAARDQVAARHAGVYRGGEATEELLLIGTASLLHADFHRRRPGKFRLPWQEAWEEICEEALDAQEPENPSSGQLRYDYRHGFDRWCEKWLTALMDLSPAVQHARPSPVAARWARAHDVLERAIKRDLQDQPWAVRLTDRLHHTGRGLVAGIAASMAEPVVVAYDGREVIDLPWLAQEILWVQYPGGVRQAGRSQHRLTALPRLFTLLDSLSRRSLDVIADTDWHDSPAVYQEAIDNVPKAAFSPDAHCWWNTNAAGRLPHLLVMARTEAASARRQAQRAQAPWR
ncbi:hypothetical protein J7E93_23980 [Streptomyces sp. ISL-36]|uniref:hypothetical protein n=1 Tax=Streptomyces sp. ISL-36 TaxID=2819182 RepID=UPI001BEA33FC|nr:hypothetical protein [Streptomyces sp. ISL-36]MBT2443103.1 hypothetical protein [Streptomyces sp. ISL-36]